MGGQDRISTWLVVFEHVFYEFPYIGNVIIPTDELIFFRGVEITNQVQ
jgi:hypothetical protein